MCAWLQSVPLCAFIEYREPAALGQIKRILAIPMKRANTRLIDYLTRDEMQALLDAPAPNTRLTFRMSNQQFGANYRLRFFYDMNAFSETPSRVSTWRCRSVNSTSNVCRVLSWLVSLFRTEYRRCLFGV